MMGMETLLKIPAPERRMAVARILASGFLRLRTASIRPITQAQVVDFQLDKSDLLTESPLEVSGGTRPDGIVNRGNQ